MQLLYIYIKDICFTFQSGNVLLKFNSSRDIHRRCFTFQSGNVLFRQLRSYQNTYLPLHSNLVMFYLNKFPQTLMLQQSLHSNLVMFYSSTKNLPAFQNVFTFQSGNVLLKLQIELGLSKY